MAKKVVIIDYKLGNLFSVNQVLLNIGLDVTISSDPAEILKADAIVLPGVGAFKDAMQNLNDMHLADAIKSFISTGKPFLGICLGLQLLFTSSEEFGASNGLNLIEGEVKRFANIAADGSPLKVPQIAWNTIHKAGSQQWENTALEAIQDATDMYFVHSYYVVPKDKSVTLTTTSYGGLTYASSVKQDNIFACQFHPEKSALEGIKIYKNWATINKLF